MRSKKIIGRTEEIALLEEYYNSNKSELVAIYGRRRVGKTYLICETLEDRFDFDYIGKYKVAAKVQIGEFQKELNRLTKNKDGESKDWFEAFGRLRSILSDDKVFRDPGSGKRIVLNIYMQHSTDAAVLRNWIYQRGKHQSL